MESSQMIRLGSPYHVESVYLAVLSIKDMIKQIEKRSQKYRLHLVGVDIVHKYRIPAMVASDM